MKHILRSAFSLAAAAVMTMSSSLFNVYAEEAASVYGEADISEELYYGDLEGLELTLPKCPAVEANYSCSGAYNYGTSLDENNVAVYMAFMKLINPSLDLIEVTLPDPVSFTVSSYSITSDEDQQALSDAVFMNCKPGMDCATFDIPELFWLDLSSTAINPENITYKYNPKTRNYTFTFTALTFKPAYKSASFDSLDEVIEYKQKLFDAIEDFEVEGDTRYEQIKSIHDQISLMTYYDTNARFASSALGALVTPGVVCEGYSKAFKLICDKLDIPCVLVYGNLDEEKQVAHMWNDVLMDDGKWYPVDITWDDLDGSYGVQYNYKYFLTASSNFYSSHDECEDYVYTIFDYPTLSDTAYDPDWAAGMTLTTTETTTTTITTTTTTTTFTTTSATVTETSESTVPVTTTTEEVTTSSETTAEPVTTTVTEIVTTKTETTTEPVTTTASSETTSTETVSTTSSETTTVTDDTTFTEETISTTESETTITETTTDITTTPEIITTTEMTTTTTEATTTTETTTEPAAVPGDINNDGILSVADLVSCANALLGKDSVTAACDVDGNGKVNVFDMIALRELISDLAYQLH